MQLLLPDGELAAALAHLLVVAVLQRDDEVVGAGQPRRVLQVVVAGASRP
jgi:hypothetical protein